MDQHTVEVVLEHDGRLTLEGLPFSAGDHVAVTIVATAGASERRRALRGTPVKIVEPFVPVAQEDWDAAR